MSLSNLPADGLGVCYSNVYSSANPPKPVQAMGINERRIRELQQRTLRSCVCVCTSTYVHVWICVGGLSMSSWSLDEDNRCPVLLVSIDSLHIWSFTISRTRLSANCMGSPFSAPLSDGVCMAMHSFLHGLWGFELRSSCLCSKCS